MSVTFFRRWWQDLDPGRILRMPKLISTSQTVHQNIWSPSWRLQHTSRWYIFKKKISRNINFCAYPLRYIPKRGNTYSRNTTWKFTLCFRKVAWWWCDDGWNWGWWWCRGVRLVESYYLANRINPTKSSLLGLATHKDKSSKSLQNCNIKSQTKSRDSTLILTISSIHFRLKSIRPDHVRPISK